MSVRTPHDGASKCDCSRCIKADPSRDRRALTAARNLLRTVLNAHSSATARDPEWTVELWSTPEGVPTGAISVVRWDTRRCREICGLDVTAAQAQAVVDALAGRGVVGGAEVERVVVAAADVAGTVAA